MNLRDIKKDIDYVLSAFIEDCSVCVAVNPKANDKAISGLMEDAVDLYNELRDKVTAKVEGSKKVYYNALRKEILERTDALYTKLSEAVAKGPAAEEAPKEEKKPAAKKAPAKKAAPKAEEEAPKEEKKPAAKKAPAKKPAAKKAPAKKEAAE